MGKSAGFVRRIWLQFLNNGQVRLKNEISLDFKRLESRVFIWLGNKYESSFNLGL